jgi:cell pole-organizing protein PopZ
MEEILASIRRIISDDGDEDAGAAHSTTQSGAQAGTFAGPQAAAQPAPRIRTVAPAPAAPRAAAVREVAPAPVVDEDRAETHLKTEDVEMIKKNTAEVTIVDDVVVDETAAAAAARAFQNLSQSVRISRGEGRTLEDIVVDILKPLVKQWLDENLPQIVEEKVEAEVQRLARLRR